MQCGQPQLTGLPLLADKAQIGDYVNYPVYYDNVNGSTMKGWRVISKDIEFGVQFCKCFKLTDTKRFEKHLLTKHIDF